MSFTIYDFALHSSIYWASYYKWNLINMWIFLKSFPQKVFAFRVKVTPKKKSWGLKTFSFQLFLWYLFISNNLPIFHASKLYYLKSLPVIVVIIIVLGPTWILSRSSSLYEHTIYRALLSRDHGENTSLRWEGKTYHQTMKYYCRSNIRWMHNYKMHRKIIWKRKFNEFENSML